MRSINVWLGGRSYRIRVEPDKEGTVRAAVKLADEKVLEMRQQYAGRDDQDFMAMVLLLYAAQSTADDFHHPVLEAEVEKMIQKVEAALRPASDADNEEKP